MAHFNRENISDMPQRYRVNFINSLSGFKSANLIGTCSASQQSNLAIISSAFHIGADPALIAFINRPHSVDRHTLDNILSTHHYTLNHVNEKIIDQAHQTSARYSKEESEFTETGLTEGWNDHFSAPYVQESLINIGIEYREHHTLLNNTVMVIGEVIWANIPDDKLGTDGLINIDNSIAVSGLDSYHSTQKIKRLSYAKPHQALKEID